MANTYTQIYIQAIFAVEGRQSLIAPEHKIEIYKYMTTVIQNQKSKVMVINGMPDHVHLLIGLNPDIALSDLVRDVKARVDRQQTLGYLTEKQITILQDNLSMRSKPLFIREIAINLRNLWMSRI